MTASVQRMARSLPDRRLAASPVELYSPLRERLFVVYLHRFFARHFHAVRTSGDPRATAGPLIVYSNHPSWWDPIHFLVLCRQELPERRIFGPMDAAALEKYRFFKRLGVFGIEPTPRGAAEFIRIGREVLATPGASLWLTAEGQFNDSRNRPLSLRPGLAHLVRRLERVHVVPLAVEYAFWTEREPEALTRFGEPIAVEDSRSRSAEAWTRLFESRLTETMDALSTDVRAREPKRFRTVLTGRAGVGGVYEGWRRLCATLRGQPFHAAHGDP